MRQVFLGNHMSRKHHSARVGIVVAGVLLCAVTSIAIAHAAAGARAQEKYSVWEGAYLEEQATRGKDQYEYNCGSCHIHDLSGDSIKDIPPLAGDDFIGEWNGKTVQELLEYITTNMPADSRGSLAASTYADIAAYVLRTNGFPTGKEALGSDAARLARTFIERKK
jgi:S-disulfanyl-L-cysteine oxidoreductase SoxD